VYLSCVGKWNSEKVERKEPAKLMISAREAVRLFGVIILRKSKLLIPQAMVFTFFQQQFFKLSILHKKSLVQNKYAVGSGNGFIL